MRPFGGGTLILIVALLVLDDRAGSQSIQIGTASGYAGATVEVPVTVTGVADSTALLLRLDYQAAVLEWPSALPNALLSLGHTLDAYSPEPGRLNVAIYEPNGAVPFGAASGTPITLLFTIRSDAEPGYYPITLTTSGTPSIPESDLVSITGARLSHTVESGGVTVLAVSRVEYDWTLYQ